MKKPNYKQLIMPFIVTFILMVAAFSIASKYELKSVIRQPLKINSSSDYQPEEPGNKVKEEIPDKTNEADSALQTEKATQSLMNCHPVFFKLPVLETRLNL